MLDDEQRMAGVEQLAERLQQLGDVFEVQAGGRLVEEEQLAAAGGLRGIGQMPGELQSLCLAAG